MTDADEPWVVTYAAPFLGVLLIVVGIAAGVMGGYSVVQTELDLCGDPTIQVADEATTAEYTGADAPALERLTVAELSPAERRAFEEALAAPDGEATVDGAFPHRPQFDAGVLIEYEGGERYAALVSLNECVAVPSLLFPLGVVSILLGIGGVVTPPLYRRLAAFEEDVAAG
ncbi:hypothetical protein [Halosegnis sp.]|uniref:hypothetical protein n=1 Tax=Halosegnis sp. TaxID=2864959 RepID=UPI0035D4CB20